MITERQKTYIPWIDVVRAMAIMGVVLCHVVDTVMAAPEAAGSDEYTLWIELYKTLSRPSVPLFVLITGYLLLPIKTNSTEFYKKRLTRILYPFLCWSVIYNLLPWVLYRFTYSDMWIKLFFPYYGIEAPTFSDTLVEIVKIPFTFSSTAYPLWYVYMLIGLYFFMPVLSAWLVRTPGKDKTVFLILWLISLFIPYIRAFVMPYVFGESEWNEFGMFYYFSGFIGYLVIAYWIKDRGHILMQKYRWLALPVFAFAFWLTYKGYHYMMSDPGVTPEGMELFFLFCTPNVMLMTLALFVIGSRVDIRSLPVNRLLSTLSRCGFGIYMIHYLFIGIVDYNVSLLNLLPVVRIPLSCVLVFAVSWTAVYLLSKLPNHKWLIG